MPKGRKRTAKDYEDEIEESARRMKKKDGLKHARTSKSWHDFLYRNDIFTYETEEGSKFWEKVRKELNPTKSNIIMEYDGGIKKWEIKITSSKGKEYTQVVFRDASGKFVSGKFLE